MNNYTIEEVSKHNTEKDCWIIIDGNVFDISKFAPLHPGGKKILLNLAGKDASNQFKQFHTPLVLNKYEKLKIGKIEDAQPKNYKQFIPYGEMAYTQGLYSPYYNESHKKFRAAMREFVEKEIVPYAEQWDEECQLKSIKKNYPEDNSPNGLNKQLLMKCYKAGILPGCSGPKWLTEYVGSNIAGGVKPEEWNSFHELILHDELGRCGVGGVGSFITLGISVAIPPILTFGSKFLKDKVIKPVLTGEKAICLAITEPHAGSDVANIQTSAKKSECGKYYIVNGEKKYITNGVYSDFFTVAVRTGGQGMGGISFLLIEKEFAGVKVKPMVMQGVWSSGTSYITFEDVKVPVENLIGEENQGFKYIMHNFNHERWMIICGAVRGARVCYEESFKYANKRKVFGKKLIESEVIRAKLGNMIRQIEATQAWLEFLTYQLTKMNHIEANLKLGGTFALLKVQSTQVLEYCAREAVQVFGGLGYQRGGQGAIIERAYRDAKVMTIGGGSEEVLLDLGVRIAQKMAKL